MFVCLHGYLDQDENVNKKQITFPVVPLTVVGCLSGWRVNERVLAGVFRADCCKRFGLNYSIYYSFDFQNIWLRNLRRDLWEDWERRIRERERNAVVEAAANDHERAGNTFADPSLNIRDFATLST